MHDGDVVFFCAARLELLGEVAVSAIVFGHDDDAGSADVESMHDPWSLDATDTAEIPAMGQERVKIFV